MGNVPRYGTSRSDRRLPDRESSANRGRSEDATLSKLERMIGRDEAFLAMVRNAASRRAYPAEEARESLPDDDLLAFDADDASAGSRRGGSPRPSHHGDDSDARQERTVRAQAYARAGGEPAGPPQLGHALSELARLVGRIDSILARGSSRTLPNDPDRSEPTFAPTDWTTGGRHTESDDVDDDDVRAIDMPVPSRHSRLTDDTEDPGLSLYVPRRKGRAAYAIASASPPHDRYGTARPRREDWDAADGGGDDYYTRPRRRPRLPEDAQPRRQGSTVLTAIALIGLIATVALYGYRTWTDQGSGRPGPIAAEAAPVTASGDLPERSAVDASTLVRSDPAALLAPASILNGASSASPVFLAGANPAAAPTTRPRRHDEGRAHRPPAVRIVAPSGSTAPVTN